MNTYQGDENSLHTRSIKLYKASNDILSFSFLQYSYDPFIIHEANKMEFILLMSFTFMVIIQLPLDPGITDYQLNILVSKVCGV